MILLEEQAALTDLHELIDSVPAYPITVSQLIDLALNKDMPKAVIDFYRAFPADEVFISKDDLLSTTESVEMLQHQVAPMEELRATED